MKLAIAFACGVLFALGLGISGMLQPAKVIGFLDFFGAWDPTLLGVMIGAIPIHLIAWTWRRGGVPHETSHRRTHIRSGHRSRPRRRSNKSHPSASSRLHDCNGSIRVCAIESARSAA